MEKRRSPSQLEAIWKEKDLVSGRVADAMVMIMRTNGCCWSKKGGCTMCGYAEASLSGVTSEDLLKQLDQALERYNGEPFVKIYTSGSFLDDNEVPPDVRERIFSAFGSAERILFESRPEFITEGVVSKLPKSVTVALGLETSNEDILSLSIRKGFTAEQSARAAYMIRRAGLKVRTYLLLKPLYLTESEAIDDMVSSIEFADKFSDEISINPVNVQRSTYVERMWKKGEYRPPWIWSLIEVMRTAAGNTRSRLMSSPSGGGTQRGVHNCGECDRDLLKLIETFSMSQNVADLETALCSCHERWVKLKMSEVMTGTASDIQRMFENDLAIRK